MRTRVLFLFFSACLAPAGAQWIQFGVTGGVPFDSGSGTRDESRRYVVGPSVEVGLPGRFAIEFDALYRHAGSSSYFYSSGNLPPGPNSSTLYVNTARYRANAWEFPLLGKFYFRPRKAAWAPYVSAGPSVQKQWITGRLRSTDPTSRLYGGEVHYSTPAHVAAEAAAGVRLNAGRLSILPEVRYSYSNSDNGFLRRNQVGFLLGMRF